MVERKVAVRLDALVSGYVRGMAEASAATKAFTREVNSSSDRASWMVGTLTAIAPAVVPIGAVAVPAVAALATQAGLAAAAGGVMALAFVGVGDALKALNDYQLDPTKANLEDLDEAMKKLGPDGAEFVRFLDEIGPEFRKLQLAARAGLFPGVEEGITALMTRLPQFKDIVTEISTTLGTLTTEAGEGLAGPEFDEFFDFLQRDAQPILLDTARAFGNFIDGFASIFVAFGPLTKDFSGGLLDMSQSFEEWAEELADSQSFQDFVDYVRRETPEVLDLLGKTAVTFVELAKAAAPVGDVMLPLFTTLIDLVGELADSPLGPLLVTTTAVTALTGRLIALSRVVAGGAIVKAMTGQFAQVGASAVDADKKVSRLSKAAPLALTGLAIGLGSVHTESDATNEALGVLASTATGAAVGSAILPGWGTAIGAVGGLVIGVVGSLNDAEEATKRVTDATQEWRDSIPGPQDWRDALPNAESGPMLDLLLPGTPKKDKQDALNQSGRDLRSKLGQSQVDTFGGTFGVTIDADTTPLDQKSKDAKETLRSIAQGDPAPIDADPDPAKRAGRQADKAINDPHQRKVPIIDADASAAIAAARSAQEAIDNVLGGLAQIGGKPKPKPQNDRGPKKAAGGPIIGPGTGTSDEVPLWGSNGEHMLTSAEVNLAGGHAAIYRMRAGIRSGDLKFASGGAVGQTARERELAIARLEAEIQSNRSQYKTEKGKWPRRVLELEYTEDKMALRRLKAGIADDTLSSSLDALRDAANAPISLLDTGSNSPWFSGGNFGARALQKAAQFTTLAGKVRQLQKLGLNGAVIAELYSLGTTAGIAAADELLRTPAQIKQLNTAYSAIQSANGFAAAAAYSAPAAPAGVKISVQTKFDGLTAHIEATARDAAGNILDRQSFESKVH